MTTSGTSSDNELHNKNIFLTAVFFVDDFFSFSLINTPPLISRLLHPSFLSSFSQISLLSEIANSYVIRKYDIFEVLED